MIFTVHEIDLGAGYLGHITLASTVVLHLNIIIQIFQKKSHTSSEITQQNIHNGGIAGYSGGSPRVLRGAAIHGPGMNM